MPIYEFKCLNCSECFEILLVGRDDEAELKCPGCNARDLERVLSCTHYNMGPGSEGGAGAKSQTRTCASGSCTTYEIPGPTG